MQIFIKYLIGESVNLDAELSDTILDIKAKIHDNHWKIPLGQQRFIFAGTHLDDGCTLSSCNIKEGDVLYLVLTAPKQILFSDEVGGGGPSIEVSRELSIVCAFERYSELRKIPLDRLQFNYCGTEIPVDCERTVRLLGIGINNDSVIDVTIKDGTRSLCKNEVATTASNESQRSMDQEAMDLTSSDESVEQFLTFKLVEEAEGKEYSFTIGRSTLLRRVFVAFAAKRNIPVDQLQFKYNGGILPAYDAKTPEKLGMKDGTDTIFVEQMQWAESSVPLYDKILIVFKDNKKNPDFQIRCDCEIYHALENYSIYRAYPLDRLQFTYQGKIIPSDHKGTVAQIDMNDCDEICAEVNPPEGEILITVKGEDGTKDGLLRVNLNSGIDCIFDMYSNLRNIPSDRLQFTYRGREILVDCKDTIGQIGMKNNDIIKVVVKAVQETTSNHSSSSSNVPSEETIIINLKDEHGSITRSKAKTTTYIYNVFANFSKQKNIPLKNLRFTNRGTEISTDSEDTAITLGIKNDDTMHVAEKTSGGNLTEKSIEIMYGMNGSVDNPSFRPNLQIIDLLRKVKYRNHWKVRIGIATSIFDHSGLTDFRAKFSFAVPVYFV